MKETFRKEERLCSKKVIQSLFAEGTSFSMFPIRVVYLPTELSTHFPAQVTFSVSKKKFKKAVDRNRIKRLMREGYRKNKHLLYDILTKESMQMAVLLIYLPRHEATYKEIEDKIILSLQRLSNEVSTSLKEDK